MVFLLNSYGLEIVASASLLLSSAQGCHPTEWGAPWGQWGVSCLVLLTAVGTCLCGQAWGLQAWTPRGSGSFISSISSSKRHWEASDEGKPLEKHECLCETRRHTGERNNAKAEIDQGSLGPNQGIVTLEILI